MADEKIAKIAKIAKEYICECCNYKCFRKNDYEKHLSTAKHKKMEISKNMINLADENVANVANEEFVYIYIIKNNLKKNTPKYDIFVL